MSQNQRILIVALSLLGISGAMAATAQPRPPRDAEIRREQDEHWRRVDERSIERHRHWDNRHHRYIYDPGYYAPAPVIVQQPAYIAPQPVYVAPPQPAYVAPAPAPGVNFDLNFR